MTIESKDFDNQIFEVPFESDLELVSAKTVVTDCLSALIDSTYRVDVSLQLQTLLQIAIDEL